MEALQCVHGDTGDEPAKKRGQKKI